MESRSSSRYKTLKRQCREGLEYIADGGGLGRRIREEMLQHGQEPFKHISKISRLPVT